MRKYNAGHKMAEIICDNASLLPVIGRFGIRLGVGDESVQQVCARYGVDVNTFLAVINFLSGDTSTISSLQNSISVEALLDYLKRSHAYFLDFALPAIRKKLVEALGNEDNLTALVLKFYDDYVGEVRRHMEYEEELVFPFAMNSNEGSGQDLTEKAKIDTLSEHHKVVDEKLVELKNIIIKYLPTDEINNNLLNSVLYEIFSCEKELDSHCRIEDNLFVPAIMDITQEIQPESNATAQDILSQREKEIVVCAVNGMTNKEIAEKLHLSVHTVLTHRKNISRKLQIHSVAALTIYAIANKLIEA